MECSPIKCRTDSEVRDEISKAVSALDSLKKSWKVRIDAMKRLQGVLTGSKHLLVANMPALRQSYLKESIVKM